MAFPVIKLLMVGFKLISKPANQMLISAIKSRGTESKLNKVYIRFGQFAHRAEVRLDRYIINEENDE